MNKYLLSQKSPSTERLEITSIRATSLGGVTQDFTLNVENIREISES
jgi:hypothetical protein